MTYTLPSNKIQSEKLGRPSKYLNWTIRYAKKGIKMSQPEHIDSVVTLLAQQECNARTTPYLDGILMDLPNENEEICSDIAVIYEKAVGEIRYIADSTRFDIAFAGTALTQAQTLETIATAYTVPAIQRR